MKAHPRLRPATARAARKIIGSVGELHSYRASFEVRTWQPLGVSAAISRRGEHEPLEQAVACAIELLGDLLGEVRISAGRDDGRGGPAAEVVFDLEGPGRAQGELVVSRLRRLGAVLDLHGAASDTRLNLSGLAARPHGRGRRPAPLAAPVERSTLAHPWEAATPPGALPALAGRKVLVTGATGFIGARLVEVLCGAGALVTAVVRHPSRAARIGRLPVRMIPAELGRDDPARVVEGQEIVVNLAHDLSRSPAWNFRAYADLADAASAAGVRRFIQTSSIAAYDAWPKGDITEDSPRNGAPYEYQSLKRAIEQDLEARAAEGRFGAAVLQPTIVYGPFSKLWTDRFARWLRSGDIVLPDEGRGLCNGVYIDDLVQALILAAIDDSAGAQTYIVSGPRPFAWRELLEGYAQVLPGRIVCEPSGAPAAPAPPGPAGGLSSRLEHLVRRSPLRDLLGDVRSRVGEDQAEWLRRLLDRGGGSAARPADAEPELYRRQGVCSIEKAQRQLGYAPRFDLAEGLALTQAYLRWRFAEGEA